MKPGDLIVVVEKRGANDPPAGSCFAIVGQRDHAVYVHWLRDTFYPLWLGQVMTTTHEQACKGVKP